MTAPSSTASSSHQNPLARSHACRSDGTFRTSQSEAARMASNADANGDEREYEP